jgi:hypothetical protein
MIWKTCSVEAGHGISKHRDLNRCLEQNPVPGSGMQKNELTMF